MGGGGGGAGGDYVHVAKNMGGIMSIYTKMSRRDFVREGFCPTLMKSAT